MLQNDWAPLLEAEFIKPYYTSLQQKLASEYENRTVYPSVNDIYTALHLTPYSNVKVVILGQDPYHGPGQAHGLSFSVQTGISVPPSLLNIYKELHTDIGIPIPTHGHLARWAEQGVLLLNTVLTVRDGQPNSHKGIGWETFTDEVIDYLNRRQRPMAFVLWGNHAQTKQTRINAERHYIVKSPHPSPLSAHRGFFGSRPFSKINDFLRSIGEQPIDWSL